MAANPQGLASPPPGPPLPNNKPESAGHYPLGRREIYLIIGYTVALSLLVLYSLVKVWPPFKEDLKDQQGIAATPTPAPNQNTTQTNSNTNNSNSAQTANANGNGNANTNTTTNTNTGANTNATANTNTGANTNTNAGNGNTNSNANGNTNASANAGSAASANTGSSSAAANPCPSPNAGYNPTVKTEINNPNVCKGECYNKRRAPVSFFCWNNSCLIEGCLWDEDRLLLIVALCGALGALAHVFRSLSWYIGNRQLYASWTAMYFMLPFLGAAIAIIFYLLIRGGFFSPGSEVSDTSPFGFAALAVLVGMFTEEAVRKLKSVAGTILEPAEQGKEHVGAAPTITSLNPPSGASNEPLRIIGTGFQSSVKVTIGGQPVTTVGGVTDTLISVVTPPNVPDGPAAVEVTNPDNQKATATYIYKSVGSPP